MSRVLFILFLPHYFFWRVRLACEHKSKVIRRSNMRSGGPSWNSLRFYKYGQGTVWSVPFVVQAIEGYFFVDDHIVDKEIYQGLLSQYFLVLSLFFQRVLLSHKVNGRHAIAAKTDVRLTIMWIPCRLSRSSIMACLLTGPKLFDLLMSRFGRDKVY